MDQKYIERVQHAFDATALMPEAYPSEDAADVAAGVRFIPFEVTRARRNNQPVRLVRWCSNPCCWFWAFGDAGELGQNYVEPGHAVFHFERNNFEKLRDQHGSKCPECGNTHIRGSGEGLVKIIESRNVSPAPKETQRDTDSFYGPWCKF